MRGFAKVTAIAAATSFIATGLAAQGGMSGGGMSMNHDSVTAAQMAVVHELMMGHDKITRTVTTLRNGIRTVTESADARIAGLVRKHTIEMTARVTAGNDPGLPMESAALRTIFRNKDRIVTRIDTTAKGIVVEQTSSDSATIVALQQHAAEVTDLVKEGMAAMHRAMMSGMSRDTTALKMHADTGFAAMQERGKAAMGVDQYTSTHHFDDARDGGRIELQRDVDDTAGVAQIREHLQGIAKAFGSGDFSTPALVHMASVPGADIMKAKRAVISYTFRELPRGGELRITSKDPDAVAAIHQFLAFQRKEHRAS